MNMARFDPQKASPAHEGTILGMDVLPPGVRAPFRHFWGYLAGPGMMDQHSHPEEEVYFFHRGEGFVVVGDEECAVGPGDVVEIPPEVPHTVRNAGPGELLWFALWWSPLD